MILSIVGLSTNAGTSLPARVSTLYETASWSALLTAFSKSGLTLRAKTRSLRVFFKDRSEAHRWESLQSVQVFFDTPREHVRSWDVLALYVLTRSHMDGGAGRDRIVGAESLAQVSVAQLSGLCAR